MTKVYTAAFIIVVVIIYLLFEQPAWIYGAEPKIYDQGASEMCGAYAVCGAVEYQMKLEGMEVPENGFSEQWLWDKCAEKEDVSCGIKLKTAMDVAYEYGLCPTDDYGTDNADKAAESYKISTYSAIDSRQFKDYIVRGHVIIIGTALDRENWKDGVIATGENPTTEGHASYLVDFDEITEINGSRDYYIGVNSWGKDWGYGGKYYMKYNYAPYILCMYVVEI